MSLASYSALVGSSGSASRQGRYPLDESVGEQRMDRVAENVRQSVARRVRRIPIMAEEDEQRSRGGRRRWRQEASVEVSSDACR